MTKTVIAAYLPSILCLIIAGWLAIEGKEGWGWFLFGAIIMCGSLSLKTSDDEKGEKREVEL